MAQARRPELDGARSFVQYRNPHGVGRPSRGTERGMRPRGSLPNPSISGRWRAHPKGQSPVAGGDRSAMTVGEARSLLSITMVARFAGLHSCA